MLSQSARKGKPVDFAGIFHRFDRDRNGYLDGGDFAAALASAGIRVGSDDVGRLVASADVDGSGRLDIEEFVRLMALSGEELGAVAAKLRAQFASGRDAKRAFRRLDPDGRGVVSPRSLGRVLREAGSPLSARESELLMAELDADGDGKVDFKDFLAFLDVGPGTGEAPPGAGAGGPAAAATEGGREEEAAEAFRYALRRRAGAEGPGEDDFPQTLFRELGGRRKTLRLSSLAKSAASVTGLTLGPTEAGEVAAAMAGGERPARGSRTSVTAAQFAAFLALRPHELCALADSLRAVLWTASNGGRKSQLRRLWQGVVEEGGGTRGRLDGEALRRGATGLLEEAGHPALTLTAEEATQLVSFIGGPSGKASVNDAVAFVRRPPRPSAASEGGLPALPRPDAGLHVTGDAAAGPAVLRSLRVGDALPSKRLRRTAQRLQEMLREESVSKGKRAVVDVDGTFSLFDEDGSGTVPLDEFTEALEHIGVSEELGEKVGRGRAAARTCMHPFGPAPSAPLIHAPLSSCSAPSPCSPRPGPGADAAAHRPQGRRRHHGGRVCGVCAARPSGRSRSGKRSARQLRRHPCRPRRP